jgi:transcriptional regulator with XRE-family HTH domain
MAAKTGQQTTDAVEILRRRFVDGDGEAEALLKDVRADADVARTIYRLRSGAKLTRQALAERVGTTPSVISRLEDADYTGHSLAMLRRIAADLGRRVEIRFPALKATKATAARGKPAVRSGNERDPTAKRRGRPRRLE